MKEIYVLMQAVNVNVDGEYYRFFATEDIELGEKLAHSLEKEDEERGESGNVAVLIEVPNNADDVYLVWLNELSRKYSGNEIALVGSYDVTAIAEFEKQWEHQEDRWGFEYTEIPKVDFTYGGVAYWRNNGGDCEQTLGIVKIPIGKGGWVDVVPQNIETLD